LGESIDEERNQESCREEESSSEEKEVARRAFKVGAKFQDEGPGKRGLFYFADCFVPRFAGMRRYFLTNFCTALFTVSAT
jgi:hypothetical protein